MRYLFRVDFMYLHRYPPAPDGKQRTVVTPKMVWVVADSLEQALKTVAEGRENFELRELQLRGGPGNIAVIVAE